jgi:polyhydroxyalkanoate synthesis regulator phasin
MTSLTKDIKDKLFKWVQDGSIHPIQAKNYVKDTRRFTKEEKDTILSQLKLLERLIKYDNTTIKGH